MEKEIISIAASFGVDAPAAAKVEAFKDVGSPYVPKKDSHYVHKKEIVRDILAFLRRPSGDAMYIYGHTGTGKTSAVTQIAAVLNWPVQQITAHMRMEFAELVGKFVLMAPAPGESPVMSWMDGPLSVAMREGHLLLINEIDLIDPGELSGLNDVLEGRPLVISENGGEIINPHPNFRVVVTGNSNGSGDESGFYQGVMAQNIAAMDRYRMIEVDYLEPEIEHKILSTAHKELPTSIVHAMVKVANEIRSVFKGNAAEVELGLTMSTRTLRRWASLTLAFKSAENPLAYGLNQALLARANSEEKEAITRICKDTFGNLWEGGVV